MPLAVVRDEATVRRRRSCAVEGRTSTASGRCSALCSAVNE